jgi:hypothetical protein
MECFCDYDSPTVYSAATPKARKEHQCIECRCTIKSGEQYERVFGVWDGSADTFKTCQRCLNLREYVKAHVPCFCWAHGNMIDDAIQTAEGWNREAPGLLFGAYRLQIKIRKARAL